MTQVVKLFLPSDVQVKEGSKVTVTQEGMTASFICSGKPAVYGSHQEIVLETEKRRA